MRKFILWTLMLGLLSVSPMWCWTAEPQTDQDQVVAEINKLGGKVFIDENNLDKPVIGVNLELCRYPSSQIDSVLEHLKLFQQLKTLNLKSSYVSEAGLEHLKELTQLQSLDLSITKVTDAGLESLRGLTQLQNLDLYFTKVTDAGLEHIKGLNQLKMLQLGGRKSLMLGWNTSKG